MKLSELSKLSRIATGLEDPEIRVVTGNGFSVVKEVLGRDKYYNETFYGTELEKGNFACIECGNDGEE